MEFRYKAIYKNRLVEGIIECEDEQECLAKLRKQGLKVILIQNIQKKTENVSDEFLEFFVKQLQLLLEAGVNLDKAVLFIAESSRNKYKTSLEKAYKLLREGRTLYSALKEVGIIPEVYLELIRAGEESGNLEEVLEHLLLFIQEKNRFVKNLISSLIYPMIIFFTFFLALSIVSIYVIPKFKILFLSSDMELPLITKLVFYFSDMFTYIVIAIISFLSFMLVLFNISRKNNKLKIKLEKVILHIPVLNKIVIYIELIKFSQVMYTLLKGGIKLDKALILSEKIFSLELFKNNMKNIRYFVLKGESLSSAIKKNLPFPQLAIEILISGEEAGELTGAFYQIYNTYKDYVKDSIDKILTVFEPLLILFVSLLVGFIVTGIMIAVFSISGSL